MMKISLLGAELVVVSLLCTGIISGSLEKQSSPQTAQQPMDRWEALDWSLKNAKPPYKTIHPKNGFVPDESTAVKIGEATAIAQYGEKQIANERPFEARLRDGIWTVAGTLHPQGAAGGTAVIRLSKMDGKILFMTHQE
jgi:hypothetical protein